VLQSTAYLSWQTTVGSFQPLVVGFAGNCTSDGVLAASGDSFTGRYDISITDCDVLAEAVGRSKSSFFIAH